MKVGSSKKQKARKGKRKRNEKRKENSSELKFRFMLSKRNLESTAGILID